MQESWGTQNIDTMLKSYREEKHKLIPGDSLEIDGKKRTVMSWAIYEPAVLQRFLRENKTYTLSSSVQTILKTNNGDRERQNSKGSPRENL